MKKIILTSLIFLTGIAGLSRAATGIKLLAVEPGARPVGMGAAFASMTGDPYSAAYNPAAIYGIGKLAGSIGHNAYWQNIRIETGYLVFQKYNANFAAGLQFAVDDNIQGRGSTPTSDFYNFDAHDVSFKCGAAFPVDKNIIFGFMAGWMFEKIDIYRGSAFNVDLGLLSQLSSSVAVGLAVQNLGGKLNLRDEEYSLPLTFRGGISYKLRKFIPAADIVIQDDKFHLHAGGEYSFGENFCVRAGFRSGYDTRDFSAGAGFVKRNLRIDYAFVPYKNSIWDTHLINLTFHL